MEKNLEGIFVAGKIVGFVSEPWARNGKSGVNHRIGLQRSYTDRWGIEVSDVQQIDVAMDAVDRVRIDAEKFRGQHVVVRVSVMAKIGGKNGAFSTYFMPKESLVIPQCDLFTQMNKLKAAV